MSKSRQPLYGSRKGSFILAVFLVLNVLLLMNWAACVAQGSELVGKWMGAITGTDQGRIPVELTVKRTSMECELHYGSPRNCELKAEYVDSEGNLHHFRFNEANGGFCDKLWNQNMSLRVNPEGTSILHVWAAEKGISF